MVGRHIIVWYWLEEEAAFCGVVVYLARTSGRPETGLTCCAAREREGLTAEAHQPPPPLGARSLLCVRP